MAFSHKNEKGMALVICLLLMVVAAMIGIGVATDSTTSGRIARNQREITRDFFVADGSNQIEVPRISTDEDLAVSNINSTSTLVEDSTDQTIDDISNDPPTYRALIRYHYYRPTLSAGYSFNMFNSYYYSTRTRTRRKNLDKTGVRTVQSKIGPKL